MTKAMRLVVCLSLLVPDVARAQFSSYAPQLPMPRTIVPLDIATVTTGGAAVTALNAGHRTAGGYLITSNAAGICISENGAAGTVTGYVGSVLTVCVAQNQSYSLLPSFNAVSVNSPAPNVAVSGYGVQ